MLKTIIFLAFSLIINVAHAEDAEKEVPVATRSFETKKTYVGFGFDSGSVAQVSGSGFHLYLGHRLTNQLLIGIGLEKLKGSFTTSGSGPSNIGQYYRDHSEFDWTNGELNFTYFFRDEGFHKWGVLLRSGLGTQWGRMSGHFERYDDDPAVIRIGDGYRLQETGTDIQKNYTRGYLCLDPAYQFFWSPNAGWIAAHILELGISIFLSNDNPSISYIRPDGKTIDFAAQNAMVTGKITYMAVF